MSAVFTSGGFTISQNWTYSNGLTIGAASSGSNINLTLSTTPGTGATQADLLYVGGGSIAASGTLNLDLAGVLTDIFGTTLTFVRVKQFTILLQPGATQATSVLVGNGTNPFINWVGAGAHTVRIRAGAGGGGLGLGTNDATGYAVTASTGDVLKIVNEDASNAAVYQIAISGCSA